MSESGLKREQKRYDIASLDRIYFMSALVVGVVVILSFDVFRLPKYAAVIACIALIVLYYLGTRFLSAFFVRADQVADNIYYLGLLYTLSSLGVALFSFSAQSYAVDSIINNFGVAIFTTIAGIAGRVLVGQMRADPIDVERETRATLIESSRRLRAELDQSVAEFKQFRLSSNQILDESIENAGGTLIRTLTTAVEKFDGSTSGITKTLQDAQSGFHEQARALNASTRRAGSAVERLIAKVDAIQADEGVIVKLLEPALATFDAAASDYAAKITGHADKVTASAASLYDTYSAVRDIKALSEQLAETVERAAVAVERTIASTRDLGALTETLNVAHASVASLATAYEHANSDYAETAKGHINALAGSVSEAVARIAESSAQKSREIQGDVDDSVRSFDQLTTQVRTFSAALDESERSISRVRQDLAAMSRYIIDRLEHGR